MSINRMVVGMGNHVQNKLWLALGTMKDHASVGKAMLCRSVLRGSSNNNDGWFSSGIEIAVVRATGHDSAPIDDKHMHEILFLVSNAPAGSSVPFLAERISHRLHKTRDRNVALKTLMLVHRLLRGGDRYFEQDLRNAYLSGHLQIMINRQRWRWGRRRSRSSAAAASNFSSSTSSSSCRNIDSIKKKYYYRKNENYSNRGGRHYSSSSPAQQQQQHQHFNNNISSSSCVVDDPDDPSISFLLNYAAFLEERMGWEFNQAGKLEPIMFQDQKVEYRLYQDKSIDTVFRRLPKYQAFLDRVLDCSPVLPLLLLRIDNDPSDRLTRAAMNNILKETFQVYMSFWDGVATLLDFFFDFKNPSASLLALQLLKTASRLTHQLSDFFQICKRIVGTKNLDYPTVQVTPSDYVLAMELFLLSSSPSPSPSPSSSSSSSSSMNNDSSSCTLSKTTSTTTTSSSPSPFCDYFSDPDLGLTKAKTTQVTVTIPRDKIIGQEEEEEEEEKGTDSGTSSPSSSSSSSPPFSCRLMETKISKVWVVFDDEEESSPAPKF